MLTSSAAIFKDRKCKRYCQKYLSIIMIFMFMLFSEEVLFGQIINSDFEHILPEDGLSQIAVNCIYQDREGILWFGTQDGLNKYNGYSFTVYKNDPRDQASLSDNWITSITQDHYGQLWIGTMNGGINRYDKAADRFIRYALDKASQDNNTINAIYEGRRGNIWVGTNAGLNILDRKADKFKRYQQNGKNSKSLVGDDVKAIYEDRAGELWIGTADKGLIRIDKNQNTTRYESIPGNQQSLSNNAVLSICEDDHGFLWIGTIGGGLNRLDKKSGRFRRYGNDIKGLRRSTVSSILKDKQGILWIGTGLVGIKGSGIFRFDPLKGEFTQYSNNPKKASSLNDDTVLSLFIDRTNILWVGTFAGGINKLNTNKARFQRYISDPDDPNSLSNNSVWSILEDGKDTLWVATFGGGLNRINRRTKQNIIYKHNPQKPDTISSNNVWVVYKDRKDTVWVGTDQGLDRFIPGTNGFTHYRHSAANKNSLSSNFILSIQEDKDGILWLGTYGGGLSKFDPKTGVCKAYVHNPKDPKSLSSNNVLSVYEDSKGMLWVGTEGGGLNKFDPLKENFQKYQYNAQKKNSLSNNVVTSIYEDSKRNIWVGTLNGLNKLDTKTGDFEIFTGKDGLPNSAVYGILVDRSGNLWLSTNNGIAKFDSKTRRIKTYDKSDGLHGNGFAMGAYFKSDSGEMFFGGPGGLSSFYPDRITHNQHRPPVIITSFKKFGIPAKFSKPLSQVREINLSHRENFFSFEFAALDYTIPEKNQYAYKLEGFDREWVYCGKHHLANYTNVGAGEYTFRVKASNNDGIWNEDGLAVKVIVSPPPWRSWWAYCIYILSTLILIGTYIRYRIQKQVSRIEQLTLQKLYSQLEQKVKKRTEELAAANEKLQTEIMERKQAEEILSQSEEKFRNLFSNMLDAVTLHRITEDNLPGAYVEVNEVACKRLGYTRDEMLSLHLHDIVAPEYLEKIKMNAQRVLGQGYATFETVHVTREGKRIPVEVNAHTFMLNGEKVILSVVRDITERKRLMEEILKAEKIKSISILAGGIAHDFNNILAVILGNICLVRVKIHNDERSKELLAKAEKACLRAKDLTQQLLAFSKGGTLRKNTASVPELLKESTNFMLSGSNVRCDFSIPEDIWPVDVDEGQFNQVINNLVINAIEAMPDGGKIDVKVQNTTIDSASSIPLPSGRYIKIAIKDYGTGIPEEYVQNIYDPYFTTKQMGNGLGLAIAYSIIKNHGGHITVESEPGNGTCFNVFLSASLGKIEKNLMDQHISMIAEAKVLIMDDDVMVREVVDHILSSLGCEVEVCCDGEEALKLYKSAFETGKPYNVVILDLTIPGGMGAKHTIEKLREIDPNVKGIVASGYSDGPVMEEYKEFGFSGAIVKPFRMEQIAKEIYSVMNR